MVEEGGKYATLPGIDNQPDVYETADGLGLPEKPGQDDFGSESVETLVIDTDRAFQKFKTEVVDSSGVDFSDRLRFHRRTGYVAGEIGGERETPETPLEKYERLQREVQELATELKELKASDQESSQPEVSPVDMTRKVTTLQQQLQSLHVDSITSGEERNSGPTPSLQAGFSRKLLSQVEAFTSSGGSTGSPATKRGKSVDCVTYELFYRPEQAKFNELSRTSELESRLARLEQLIGKDGNVFGSITAGIEGAKGDVMSSMSVLQAKMALLDPQHVEAINARLAGVLHNLAQVSQKKAAVEDAAKQSRISELYDTVCRWESVTSVIPDLISRLQALKVLHEQAAHFSRTIRELDVSQQQISSQLQTQDTVFKELKKSFEENMKRVEGNCASLDARVQKLLKK